MSVCPEPGGPCHIPDGITIAGIWQIDRSTDLHFFISQMQPRQFFVHQSYTFSVELYKEERNDFMLTRLRLLGYDLN